MAPVRRAPRHTQPLEGRVVPPAPSTIDLHTHTARSDGILEPLELARQVAAAGVTTVSITDHDTLAGVREVLASDARPATLTIIPGVELNAVVGREDLREAEVHILALGVDPDDERLETVLAAQRDRRRIRFERMVERLRELDLPVDDALETLPATGDEDALGRPRLARAMIAKGYVTSVEDAFVRYLSRGCPAYVPRDGLGPVEAIREARAAGALPVLAHFAEAPERRDVVRELMEVGLGGIEVYYRTFTIPTVEAVGEVAREEGLIATGGSDYHGDRETYAEAHGQIWVPPSVGDAVRRAIAGPVSAPPPGTAPPP